jgi:hypothetical protein
MSAIAPRRASTAIPWAAAAIAAVTLVVGLTHADPAATLGLPHPPLVGNWTVRAHPLLALSIACFAAAVALVPRLLAPRVPPWAFAVAAGVMTLVLRLVLNAGRGGTESWAHPFRLDGSAFEGPNEYLPALNALDKGPRWFLDRFAELVPALPVHAAGHPPGLLLVMDALALDTPARLAALCIVAGALAVPATYGLARTLLEEPAARAATLLLAFAPGTLLFGTTSADAVYELLGVLAAWALVARRPAVRALGAIALAVASLFAWSLLAVGAWAALLVLLREGRRRALALSVACGAALVALYALLYAASGFDPIGTLRATEQVYRLGIAQTRPYWFWLTGSPTAFLVALGLPISWYALCALAARRAVAVAVFGVIAVACLAGFTKAETERIWLFFAPLVCLAAATELAGRPRAMTIVAALLALQGVLYGLAVNTVW